MRKTLLFWLLLTICIQANAQFEEDFEASPNLPSGWNIINQGSAGTWFLSTSVGSPPAHSGTRAAAILYDENVAHNDFLVLPQIEVASGSSNRVTFWIRSRDAEYPEPYEVRLSTTGNTNASDFTVVLQPEELALTNWNKKLIDISAFEGQTVYVAIRATGLNQYALYVDDIQNDAVPQCAPVTGLSVSDITANSATLDWNDVAADFQYVIGPVSVTDPDTLTPTDVATNTAVASVEPGITYKAWGRSNCSGAFGDWTEPVIFTSVCAPLPASELPWTEGFESVTVPAVGPDVFPNCWIEQGTQFRTSMNTSFVFDTNARTGTKFLAVYRASVNNYMWLPAFALEAGKTYDLSFFAASWGNYTGWNAEVVVNTSVSSTNAATLGAPFYTMGTMASDIYAEVKRSFTPSVDGTYYFAIRVNEYSMEPTYLSFDDFRMEENALSAPEFEADTLKSYPNPVTDVLHLTNSEIMNSVEIFDLIGKKVLSRTINANEADLDLSTLQTGSYVLKVGTPNGIRTGKIIKR